MRSDVAAARRAHDTLVHALHAVEEAEKNAVTAFARIYRERHFLLLGYSSIYHYAEEALHFKRGKTEQFVRLAKDMVRLPELARALEEEKLTWTQAREVGKVATPETQKEWVERATQTSRRELEREVRAVRQRRRPAAQLPLMPTPRPVADPPVRYAFELTPLQMAEAQALLERLQPGRDRAQLFLDALAALVAQEGKQTEKKIQTRVGIVAYRCERCEGVDVPTGDRLRRLEPVDAEALGCDADVVDRSGRKRSRIPPRLRRRVLARDRHRCVRCGQTRYLQVHHRRRQAEGGRHTLENCVTVCAPCHRLHHRQEGSAPQDSVDASSGPRPGSGQEIEESPHVPAADHGVEGG